MNDMTNEQVMQLIQEFYPNNVDEAMQVFNQTKSEGNLSNTDTIIGILQELKRQGIDVLANSESDNGRFSQLREKMVR